MPKPQRIITISDLHVGSKHGLCPDLVEMDEGAYKSSKLQKAVYKEWKALIKRLGKPDVLFFLGDGVDGKQKKEYGKPCWTTSFATQAEVCGELIDQWQAKKVYGVHGTGYHAACEGERMEEALMQDVLNAVPDNDGVYAPPHRFVEVGGVVFHLCHKHGVTKIFRSRGSSLRAQMSQAREQFARGLGPLPDVILRGHAHRYDAASDASMGGFVIPPWQLTTPYAQMNSPLSWLCEIGCVEFTVSGGRWTYEEHIIEFKGRVKGIEKA